MPYSASEGRSLHLVAAVVSDASAGRHHLAAAYQTSSARDILLTTRCQFFLGALPPLLAALTLAALARHLLLGRESYAKRYTLSTRCPPTAATLPRPRRDQVWAR